MYHINSPQSHAITQVQMWTQTIKTHTTLFFFIKLSIILWLHVPFILPASWKKNCSQLKGILWEDHLACECKQNDGLMYFCTAGNEFQFRSKQGNQNRTCQPAGLTLQISGSTRRVRKMTSGIPVPLWKASWGAREDGKEKSFRCLGNPTALPQSYVAATGDARQSAAA